MTDFKTWSQENLADLATQQKARIDTLQADLELYEQYVGWLRRYAGHVLKKRASPDLEVVITFLDTIDSNV